LSYPSASFKVHCTFFLWVLNISSSLWFYDFLIFFYEKFYYLLAWESDSSSGHMGTRVSVFFKNHWSQFLLLRRLGGLIFSPVLTTCNTWRFSIWESNWNLRWNWIPPWELPNTGLHFECKLCNNKKKKLHSKLGEYSGVGQFSLLRENCQF
jgi:hypothetical protein